MARARVDASIPTDDKLPQHQRKLNPRYQDTKPAGKKKAFETLAGPKEGYRGAQKIDSTSALHSLQQTTAVAGGEMLVVYDREGRFLNWQTAATPMQYPHRGVHTARGVLCYHAGTDGYGFLVAVPIGARQIAKYWVNESLLEAEGDEAARWSPGEVPPGGRFRSLKEPSVQQTQSRLSLRHPMLFEVEVEFSLLDATHEFHITHVKHLTGHANFIHRGRTYNHDRRLRFEEKPAATPQEEAELWRELLANIQTNIQTH